MCCNYIESNLERIFLETTGVDFKQNSNLKKELLFSSSINMEPRDLVVVFCNMLNFFDIKIPEEIILNKNLKSFDSIVKVINNQLNQ
ncbi:peptide maturation system acyl carrier-related protein [Paraclostridium sp. AKS46]|uniref:peptide maturation system acyl carrier-related protein n=1 Tax=Paraclostridium bifermentans TaxID=1490 RepID=UPI0018FE5AB0|nr:peptide maturation system acyl carrier-related protein [Paraclostridium bifermentans]MCU9809859.1 peptide maturation system acyl carrier-related protein [Paraclostridium sp. AKS46]